jgi:hypothetical protein
MSDGHDGPGKEEKGTMFSPTITRIMRHAGRAVALAGVLGAAPAFAQGQPAAAPAAPSGYFTTAELARFCGPAADDANASAMRPACYATIVAVGQTHALLTNGPGAARPTFCLPEQTLTLERVSAAFVSWAATNQQYAGTRAAEGLLRFSEATYPCAPAAPAPRRRR